MSFCAGYFISFREGDVNIYKQVTVSLKRLFGILANVSYSLMLLVKKKIKYRVLFLYSSLIFAAV